MSGIWRFGLGVYVRGSGGLCQGVWIFMSGGSEGLSQGDLKIWSGGLCQGDWRFMSGVWRFGLGVYVRGSGCLCRGLEVYIRGSGGPWSEEFMSRGSDGLQVQGGIGKGGHGRYCRFIFMGDLFYIFTQRIPDADNK